MTELHINQAGEAIIVDKDNNDSQSETANNNPFMQLSNDLIEDWSPSITQNAAKTWKSSLKSTNSSLDDKQKEDLFLQDFLNSILPPIPTKITKQTDDNGIEEQTVYSLVSTKQVRRSELDQMKQTYEALIHQRRAREFGLDSIRYQLSFQLFDELIRQIAIDCKERGLLLLRLRDEAKVRLQAHGILNQVSSTYDDIQNNQHNHRLLDLLCVIVSAQTKVRKVTKDLKN